MRNSSKTLTTLIRLRQQYQEEQERKEALERQKQQLQEQQEQEDSREDLENRNSTPLPFSNTSVDIVEFHPEELNDICPLKPEEADALELADILQGDDLSFLEEIHEDDSNAIIPAVAQPNQATTHRIPSDLMVVYDKVGHKRRRLSSMDDGW